jgi:NAD(P)-dependent dehydrogenase (short-subunit alcohol dehydrogenase family)
MSQPSEVVLVTGGAKRLGAALCREYASRGRTVVCHYERSADAATALVDSLRDSGATAQLVHGDLGDLESVHDVFRRACEAAGRVDVIVNNAAIFEPDTGLDPSAEQLDAHWRINVRAPLLLGALLARHCRDRGVRGALVHLLDQKIDNLNPDYFSYTVSKLALASSVRLQAQALAPHVRVTGIVPGLLDLSGPQTPMNFAWASRQNLLGQPVALQDVARASADATANVSVTGAMIHVDCGQHLVGQPRDVMFLGPEQEAP